MTLVAQPRALRAVVWMQNDPNDTVERGGSRVDAGTLFPASTTAILPGRVGRESRYQLVERPTVERLLVSHPIVVESFHNLAQPSDG